MTEEIGVVRRLLQDLVAPKVERLEERMGSLSDKCVALAEEIAANREDIKELFQALHQERVDVRERVGRMEGRIENLSEEIMAKLKLGILQASSTKELPESTES